MSDSSWLATSSASNNNDAAVDLDPWADSSADLLRVPSSSTGPHQLRNRRSSSSSLTPNATSRFPAATSEVVDRHPLRSPSPGQHRSSSPYQQGSVDGAERRPSVVASEWKAISAGLAGLFGGATTSQSSEYRWPADPVSAPDTAPRRRTNARSDSNSATGEIHSDVRRHDDLNRVYTNGAHEDDALDKQRRPDNDPIESTLQRLEDWFGLRDSPGRRQDRPTTSFDRASAPRATKSNDVRVLIHPVAPTDTLSSLALHYGADIQILRKSNKLWPGDPVQIRQHIYVPIDSCRHRPPNAEIKVISGHSHQGDSIAAISSAATGGSLVFVPKDDDDGIGQSNLVDLDDADHQASLAAIAPANDPAISFMPDTNKSYAASSSNAASALNTIKPAYPASLMPSMRNTVTASSSSRAHSRAASSVGAGSNPASASAASSSFVPPRGPLRVSKVASDKLHFFTSDKRPSGSSESRKLGPGDVDYNPGESGIDDLLSLQTKSIRAGTAPEDMNGTPRTSLSRLASTDHASDLEEDEWKPNKWHFGAVDKGKARADSTRLRPSASTSDISSAAQTEDGASTYAGWNDAPPPNVIVAKAYDGGKAHQRRQAQRSHRLLYDLAAGLPPNPGPASKWARPIQFGDSLPAASPSESGPPGGPRSGGSRRKTPAGFGKLFDDALRGRISVEAAFEGALEGVRAKASAPSLETSASNGRRIYAGPSPAYPALQAGQEHGKPSDPTSLTHPHRAGGVTGPSSAIVDPLATASPAGITGSPIPTRAESQGLSKRRVEWTRGKAD
ncbi:hypothetical protein BCV70DRAFT_198329 [Testicularia cyperi]|uniref:LysM domain-containing protein n=1 Tax=Testicularia cyperi TaxID=1882483 RepID=A0A317XVW7_9BASI|nr:hypothetical protein BCV70DRAFT_198329 [Testicularia cyperi]